MKTACIEVAMTLNAFDDNEKYRQILLKVQKMRILSLRIMFRYRFGCN